MRCNRNAHHLASRNGKGACGRIARAVCPADVAPTLAILIALALAGCDGGSGLKFTQTLKHGHQFRDNDITQIQPGMSQDQVKLTLGTPTTTAAIATGNAYYYISSTAEQIAFLSPKEVDRQVVAVYFNPLGSVERVANYGIKDGKVFDFVTRTTPAPGAGDEGLLKGLFRNLGKKQIFGE